MGKVISGILSVVPLVLFIGTLAILMPYYMAEALGNDLATMDTTLLPLALVGAVLSVIAVYGVMIWFIVKTAKRNDFTGGKKALWIILLYMLNMFVFPIFWFLYIRTSDIYVK